MYCPKCGKENPDNAQLCQSCSWLLSSPTPVTAVQNAKTSGLAVAALICGILSLFTCGLAIIPALILGIIALVKINQSRGQLKGNGLAITGIAIPVAAIPVIALLMAILMPALAQVRSLAQRTVCAANLRALSSSLQVYAADWNDKYPPPDQWCDLLIEYADVSERTFTCPSAAEGPCNYAMNINIQQYGTASPPNMVLLFETEPGWNQAGGAEILSAENHRGEGCNILFNDGRVEFVETERLHTLQWTTEPPKFNQIYYSTTPPVEQITDE